MESHADNDGFKYIPLRIYSEDGTFIQRLIGPKNMDGSRKSVQQILRELYPENVNGKYK